MPEVCPIFFGVPELTRERGYFLARDSPFAVKTCAY